LAGNVLKVMSSHQPRSISIVDNTDWQHPFTIADFKVVDSYAYVLTAPVNAVIDETKLYIMDVSNLDKPKMLGEYTLPGYSVPDLEVETTTAYIDIFDRIYVLDVSDPENPIELNVYQALDSVFEMIAFENSLYITPLSTCDDILVVLDVTEPNRIYEKSRYQNIDFVGFDIVKNYGYFSSGATIKVFDLSAPENPVEINSYTLPESHYYAQDINDLVVADGKLYITLMMGGIVVVDAQSLIPENE
jgi:hypothetical protein